MKKFPLVLLGLTSLLAITGCNSSESSSGGESSSKYKTPAESVMVNLKSATLLVGETLDLEVTIKPLAAYDAKLTFKSSASSVASVSSKGVVKGKAKGYAVISVYAEGYSSEEETPDLIDTMEVVVYKEGDKSKKAAAIKELVAYQKEHCTNQDRIVLYDNRVYDLVQEGVSQDRSTENQIFAVDAPEGLMNYSSRESYINVTNGGKSFENYGYISYTKDSYASYMYHYNDTVKNVYYIASEFNKGKATRYETMCGVLDSYFSVDHTYFTGAVEDKDYLSQDWIEILDEYSSLVKKYGTFTKGNDYFATFTLSQSYNDEFSAEDETRYATQLPAGIKTRVSESYTYTWKNGYLLGMQINSKTTFKMEGKNYQYNISLNKTYELATSERMKEFIPDDSQFNNVEYWYDI